MNCTEMTFTTQRHGKKWATVCRTDGFWSITYFSKNKRRARRKGEEFVAGIRTATRKYVTASGQASNTAKSQKPKHIALIGHRHPSRVGLALMAACLLHKSTDN